MFLFSVSKRRRKRRRCMRMYVGLVNQRRGDKMRSFAVRLVLIWGSWWGEADKMLEVARWLYWVWGLVDYAR